MLPLSDLKPTYFIQASAHVNDDWEGAGACGGTSRTPEGVREHVVTSLELKTSSSSTLLWD